MYYQGKINNLHHTLLLLLYCLLRVAAAAAARATCDPPSRGSKPAPPGAAITQSVIGRWADDGTSSLREAPSRTHWPAVHIDVQERSSYSITLLQEINRRMGCGSEQATVV
jgi:hypothetical protein